MNDALVSEIVARFLGGASLRRIARELRVSYHSVRRPYGRSSRHAAVVRCRSRRHAAASSTPTSRRSATCWRGTRHHGPTCPRGVAPARLHGGIHGPLGACAAARVRRPVIAPVRRFETAPGLQAQMDYSTYDLDFSDEGRRRVHAFSYVLGYSRAAVPPLRREPGLRHHRARARRVRAPGRGRGDVPLRQHEGRRQRLRRRRARVQPAIPGLRGSLWLSPGGLPPRRPQTKGKSRATILWLCRNQLAWRPDLPRSGAPERDRGVVADRGRRCARPPPDQGASRSTAMPRNFLV